MKDALNVSQLVSIYRRDEDGRITRHGYRMIDMDSVGDYIHSAIHPDLEEVDSFWKTAQGVDEGISFPLLRSMTPADASPLGPLEVRQLVILVNQLCTACVDASWAGAMPPDESDAVYIKAKKTGMKLTKWINAHLNAAVDASEAADD